MKKEALQAAKDAYIIEKKCIEEMLGFFDEEAFSKAVELLKNAENRYALVIATSKRARQIANGDICMTKVKERSTVTLAANEIAEGKVREC